MSLLHRDDAEKPPPAESRNGRLALADLYDRCAGELYRYALMILADPAGAEDAVHQAFYKLLRSGQNTPELREDQAYLRVAVRNECYSMLRRGQRRTADSLSRLLEPHSGQQEDADEREAIESALRVLPADQREVVHLKVFEGLTFREISGRIGVPLNTAASRYRYALERLRGLLNRDRSVYP
ncbi:MAG TPA: sigma-70 family RNA polymerase sigma factor [Phycisphaerae bacterium]|nr:sigma-70 family RNA polymerase sigma factor [Phycisphaerae bacterium]HRY66580.1 sigma-70 family RNA polymerase sigma factor [Phycisphaerae bacterium]HSA27000.1 sigma-70 family RNA polymerase sigma factor [Phycisphaerae bacterium]